jgi:hypothetical protein
MSNTVTLDPAKPIRGDFGLGLCLACLRDHLQAVAAVAAEKSGGPPAPPAKPRIPHFAIALAPSPIPVPGPTGEPIGMTVIALPSCYDHLMTTSPMAPRRGLLVPGGVPL